jgi:hypothetical protein
VRAKMTIRSCPDFKAIGQGGSPLETVSEVRTESDYLSAEKYAERTGHR